MFVDLEYSKLEKAEMIIHLDKLHTSYQVYSHKVRQFFWNVIGQDHFNLRTKFKAFYSKAFNHMDDIAERIRLFDQQTTGKWTDILKISEIKESESDLTSFEMVKAIVADLRILLSIQSDCIEKAKDLGDYGTESMMKDHLKELELDYLSLVSWLK